MRNGEATARVLEALRDAVSHAREVHIEANDGNRGEGDVGFAVCLGLVDGALMTIKALSAKPRGRPPKTGAAAS